MEIWCGSSERKGNVTWITGYWIDHRRLERNRRRAKLGKKVRDQQWLATAWIEGSNYAETRITNSGGSEHG
jgi:hypothetical protein